MGVDTPSISAFVVAKGDHHCMADDAVGSLKRQE